MTNRQAGGSTYTQELYRIRNAASGIRAALERIEEGVGPQTLAVLVAKIAVQLTVIFDALSQLEYIGRQMKAERRQKKD